MVVNSNTFLSVSAVPVYCKPGPKFTDDLRTILRQFSDLRQSYDNWRIYRTL